MDVRTRAAGRSRTTGLAVGALLAALSSGACAQSDPLRVLIFSKTAGFRHDSIDTAHVTLAQLARRHRFLVESSEDAAVFTAAGLARFDVVLFANTTGDVLDAAGQDALQAFVTGGGGWVGVHAAADTEYDWPFYGELLGNDAWFAAHPAIQSAQVLRESASHPAVAHFAPTTAISDEWYNFRANPRVDVQVLLALDESSYAPGGGAMGADHPIAWAREVGSGRAFYTGLGHRRETYARDDVQQHLTAAIFWAADQPLQTLMVDGFEP